MTGLDIAVALRATFYAVEEVARVENSIAAITFDGDFLWFNPGLGIGAITAVGLAMERGTGGEFVLGYILLHDFVAAPLYVKCSFGTAELDLSRVGCGRGCRSVVLGKGHERPFGIMPE